MEQLRTTSIMDTEQVATKPRFALFSLPPPLAVGDDSPYRTKQRIIIPDLDPRRQDGKPFTEPRNFMTNPPKSGKTKSSYFQQPGSIYRGDPYMDEYMKNIRQQNKRYKDGKVHENEFKPASGFKTLATATYKDIEPLKAEAEKKKIIRDQNGRVKTEPRNIQTNPCQKIETNLLKFPKHMPDEYERKHQLEREHEKNMIKKRGQAPFRSMSHSQNVFNKNKIVYGGDTASTNKSTQNRTSVSKMSMYPHEAVFKPSNPSRGTLQKFPQYKPQSPLEKTISQKKASQPELEKKDVFKPNRFGLTRPTPSITLNPINLRKSLNR